ncbi:MAG: nucleotidyltransferase domain-containing protein [Chitinophagales bacterium]
MKVNLFYYSNCFHFNKVNKNKNMNIPEIIKKEIIQIDQEAQVILYGSRARGNYREDSDWDFLILTSFEVTEKEKRKIRDKLFEIELQTDAILSSIIESQQGWLNYKVTPLYYNISKEGLQL